MPNDGVVNFDAGPHSRLAMSRSRRHRSINSSHPADALSLDAHILCCVEVTQNSFAQLAEPGFEAAITSLRARIGEFVGSAFDGRLDSSVTTDLGSFTVSLALPLREV